MRVENATLEIKRSYKSALANLEGVKKDTTDLLALKDKIYSEVAELQEVLNKVKNDISQEKLGWATLKHDEMVEIENKKAEAENVIKRKAELNEQEEIIRKAEASSIEARNEARRLELEIKAKETALETRKRELEEDKKNLGLIKTKLLKDKEDFKKKVLEELEKVKNI